MGLGIFDDQIQGTVFVFGLVTAPILIFTLILRFLSTQRPGRKIEYEDWFALAALLVYLLNLVLLFITIFTLNGKTYTNITAADLQLVPKLTFVEIVFSWVNQLLAKCSLLFLYYRIFGVHRVFALCIYAIAFIHVGLTIAIILTLIFGCRPISKSWIPTLPGECVTNAPRPFLAGTESVNSGVDFAMVILAMVMVHRLQMRTSVKLKLGILFALGGLAGVIGLVKIAEFYANGGGVATKAINETIGLWSIIQQAASVACCCAPMAKHIFPKNSFGDRVLGSMKLYGSMVTGLLRTKTSQQSFNVHSSDDKDSWLRPDMSGEAKRPWTEVDAQRRPSTAGGSPVQPTKTTRLEQNVERIGNASAV